MSEELKMVEQLEEKDAIKMQIVDMCETKKEYSKIVSFCKGQLKEFKSLLKESNEVNIHQVKQIKVSNKCEVTCTICNFMPNSYNKNIVPLEIQTILSGENKTGLTTKGSAMFGGCNEAEYSEFITLLKEGLHDFAFIKEVGE